MRVGRPDRWSCLACAVSGALHLEPRQAGWPSVPQSERRRPALPVGASLEPQARLAGAASGESVGGGRQL